MHLVTHKQNTAILRYLLLKIEAIETADFYAFYHYFRSTYNFKFKTFRKSSIEISIMTDSDPRNGIILPGIRSFVRGSGASTSLLLQLRNVDKSTLSILKSI